MKMILLLILMTSVCWAKNNFIDFTTTPRGPTVLNILPAWWDEEGKSIKISCPDGYKLEARLFRKNKNTEPCPKLYTIEACIDSNSYTDAELKCVKDN